VPFPLTTISRASPRIACATHLRAHNIHPLLAHHRLPHLVAAAHLCVLDVRPRPRRDTRVSPALPPSPVPHLNVCLAQTEDGALNTGRRTSLLAPTTQRSDENNECAGTTYEKMK
jgi:hypothetical protein